MRYVVGITGSIACGKSFVAKTLKDLGYSVVDTDKISHLLTADGSYANKELASDFPEAVKDGRLNRAILGQIVFNDKTRRLRLNQILHPLIYKITKEKIEENDGIIFIDVPLMFEAHFDTLCDKIICVYTDKDTQIKRLMERDRLSYDDAQKKINSQMPLEEKMARSDFLLKSEEDFFDTKKNIDKILTLIKEEYNAKAI